MAKLSKNIRPENVTTDVKTDLEKGTALIKGISETEPRTPEEIIRLLQIDTENWKLSQYWNKEKQGRWEISALVTKIDPLKKAASDFVKVLESYRFPKFPIARRGRPRINKHAEDKVAAVISLQDLHFGKTGNEDIDAIMLEALQKLADRAHHNYVLEKIFFIIGPDTLNMDTFNGTTTKGTPVENSESATQAYLKAFEALCRAIQLLKGHCLELEVIFVPGNHDRLSSFHLVHAASKSFTGIAGVSFDIEYAERKVKTYGLNMIATEHGDIKAKNNPLVFAVEFPDQWGKTVHRMLYTGHLHGRKTAEFITENEQHGFTTRIIPALTSSDYYHYHNKYTGNKRTAIMHIHHPEQGLISEFSFTYKPTET
jgi:hypothetical protein